MIALIPAWRLLSCGQSNLNYHGQEQHHDRDRNSVPTFHRSLRIFQASLSWPRLQNKNKRSGRGQRVMLLGDALFETEVAGWNL
jgi:hypothetical protein